MTNVSMFVMNEDWTPSTYIYATKYWINM